MGSHILEAQGSPSSAVPSHARARGTGMPFRAHVPWHRPPREPCRLSPAAPREEIKGNEKPCLAPCTGGSLSRHQMALIALFCTACGHGRVHAHSHRPSHLQLGLGGCATGQRCWQGVQQQSRTCCWHLRLALGLHLETRLLELHCEQPSLVPLQAGTWEPGTEESHEQMV